MESESLNVNVNEKRGKYSNTSLEQKEQLIKFYWEGDSIKCAAQKLGINSKTAYHIIKRYKANDCQIEIKKRGGTREKKLTPEILKMVENDIEYNPGISLRQIQRRLALQNITICKTTIDNWLRELKITLKLDSIPLDRINSPETIEERKEYALQFSQNAPEDPRKIIFIGECGFKLHLKKSQAQSKKISNEIDVVPSVHGKNITLFAAMNNEKIIYYNIISKGPCNSQKFYEFINGLQEKLKGNNDSYIIMDNARIEKSAQVQELISSLDQNVQFLPSYSLMLNPTNKVFYKIKVDVRNCLSQAEAEHDLVSLIEQSINTISSSDCSYWFFDMMVKLGSAAEKEELN